VSADSQETAPFLDSLQKAKTAPGISFHMPGHKFKAALNPPLADYLGGATIEADLSEMNPGVDYLHAAKAELLQAQRLAAQACGADRTFFLINGSTVGNLASILAVVQDGQKIIVPRASHRSVYGGLILSGATPVYVPPLYHPEVGFPLAVAVDAVAEVLRLHPDTRALQITSPNYYGVLSDVAGLIALAHGHIIPILVDEAHGAHLPYHPDLPPSAVRLGADVVVQSAHKTLGALTQAALLHLNGERVNVTQLERFLAIMQSSSPSVLLTASLDASRQQMATRGKALLDNALQLAQHARARIREISGLWCYGEEWLGSYGIAAYDPTKLVIRVGDTGQSGPDFARRLADEQAVHVEFADLRHVICSITIADSETGVEKMLAALRAVAADSKPSPASAEIMMPPPELPQLALNPRQANLAPSKPVRLAEAVGEICAEQIMPYPPGIPLLVPGEIIDADTVDYLRYVQGQGVKIVGPEDLSLQTIRIITR
jgi:arginine decarboxylase